ncbi:hypothetical protein [Streptomyces sp. NPDC007917]|uniref:hypothetical protein n=1 Tax=Streptomyces sp. NPDC007917 TaxID=3364793 RepID=UPI0036F0A15D
MTESESPRVHMPPIVVLGVQPNHPPFRLIEVAGEVIGKAHSVLDVIEIARMLGMEDIDLDDPDVVRWVGGDKFTWTPLWPVAGKRRRGHGGRGEGEGGESGETGEGPGEAHRHHRWRS